MLECAWIYRWDHLHGVYVTRVVCPACIDLQYSFMRTIEGWVTLVAGVHRSSVHYWLLWDIRAGIWFWRVHVSNTANRHRSGGLECIFCIERVKISSVPLVKVLSQALVVQPFVGHSKRTKKKTLFFRLRLRCLLAGHIVYCNSFSLIVICLLKLTFIVRWRYWTVVRSNYWKNRLNA